MAIIEGYNLPDELYYHIEHSWARVEADGNVRVGMSDFFQKEAGDIVSVDLPFDGDDVEQGETCGRLQSSKWIGKLCSPVSGTIVEVNYDLEDDSTLINRDPYGGGWIMVLKPSNLDAELKDLMHGDAVERWLRAEMERAEAERTR